MPSIPNYQTLEQCKSIFMNNLYAILLTSKDYPNTVFYVNSAAEELFGYSEEEIYKMGWRELVDNNDSQLPDFLEILSCSGNAKGELLLVKKDGSKFPGEISTNDFIDSNISISVSIVKDLSKRNKFMRELQMSEGRFRAVAESNVDAIIITDMNGTILFSNNSLEKIFGYSEEEIIGEQITILMPDRYKEGHLNGLKRYKIGENSAIGSTRKTNGLKKDGTEVPIEMSFSAYKSGKEIYLSSVIRDISEREKAEKKIKTSLKEKEILLKEIHHRVKNNLQIISSLLNLQKEYVDDEEALNVLLESQNRVKAMAIIHENLYQSNNLSYIKFDNYLEKLVSTLFYSYNKNEQIKSSIDVEDIKLNIDTAIPCGLIINELISNSLKHAFNDEEKGLIKIIVKKHYDGYELIVYDNGMGFPEDIDFKNTHSLGLKLVNSLVDQINGQITMNQNQGTEFKINFKEIKYENRI